MCRYLKLTHFQAGLLTPVIILVAVVVIVILPVLNGGRHIESGIRSGLLHLLLRDYTTVTE
jgi:hypothetical protein